LAHSFSILFRSGLAPILLLGLTACFPVADDDSGSGSVNDGGATTDGGSVSDGGGLTCGNGTIDPGEECEPGLPLSSDCQTLGFADGTLGCSSCRFDTSACTALDTCNNGQLDTLEVCEGYELRGETCTSQGRPGGTLACTDKCTLDLSGCSLCGDGVIGEGEVCDVGNFGGETCASVLGSGFEGHLECVSNCQSVDSNGCYETTPRDEWCTSGDVCAEQGTCTTISAIDPTKQLCLLPCPRSDLGQRSICPTGEMCLVTPYWETQPGNVSCTTNSDCDETNAYLCVGNGTTSFCARSIFACGTPTPISGDFSGPSTWRNGAPCTRWVGEGHNYCTWSTDPNAAEPFCEDTGSSGVCLAICDGNGGPDLTCPSGTVCRVPQNPLYVVRQRDLNGDPVSCRTDPDCPDVDYSCVTLSDGSWCARPAKMCANP
jgi:hypothetical protein